MKSADKIDLLVSRSLDAGIFTACSLTVCLDGDTYINRSWGYVDPETKHIPVEIDTYFDIASITKIFTTTALLSLLSETTLNVDLHTPLVEIIPEFGERSPRAIAGKQDPHTGNFSPVPEALQGKPVDPASVTIEHLLTHTSGLPPWRDLYNAAGDPPKSPAQLNEKQYRDRWNCALGELTDYDFVDLPGKKVHYSDLGFLLLGEVVARLGSGRLDEVIEQQVSRSVGLTHTCFNPMLRGITRESIVPTEYDNKWRKRRIWGEVHDENACGVGGIAGHAGLFSTASDVASLGRAWLINDDSSLAIGDALHKRATTLQADDDLDERGLGWMMKSAHNSSAGELLSAKSYGHTGFTGTSLWIDPEARIVVSLMTNRVYPGRDKIGVHSFRREIHDLVHTFVTPND